MPGKQELLLKTLISRNKDPLVDLAKKILRHIAGAK